MQIEFRVEDAKEATDKQLKSLEILHKFLEEMLKSLNGISTAISCPNYEFVACRDKLDICKSLENFFQIRKQILDGVSQKERTVLLSHKEIHKMFIKKYNTQEDLE
jgi:hypothetical protein